MKTHEQTLQLTPKTTTLLKSLGFYVGRNFTTAFAEAIHNSPVMVQEALARLSTLPGDLYKGIYVGTSGGKDSVLVQWLADQALPMVLGIDKEAILAVHTVKTSGANAVHPLTIDFLYHSKRTIIYAPAANHKHLKLKTQIDGTRRSEHNRTNGRSTTLISDGKEISREEMPMFVRNGLFGLNFVFPIFDWSDEDVWAAILLNQIPYSPEYLHAST